MIPGTTRNGMPAGQGQRLLAAAPEHEGIAPLQPQHPAAVPRQLDQPLGDVALFRGRHAAALAGELPLGPGAREVEDASLDQGVVDDHVGAAQRVHGVQRQQPRIARAGTDQPHRAGIESRQGAAASRRAAGAHGAQRVPVEAFAERRYTGRWTASRRTDLSFAAAGRRAPAPRRRRGPRSRRSSRAISRPGRRCPAGRRAPCLRARRSDSGEPAPRAPASSRTPATTRMSPMARSWCAPSAAPPPAPASASGPAPGVGTVTRPGLRHPARRAGHQPGAPRHDARPPSRKRPRRSASRPTSRSRSSIPGGEALARAHAERPPRHRRRPVHPRHDRDRGAYSCAAWIDTIHRGIDVARALGLDHVAGATGATSEAAVQGSHGLPEPALIDMGDFVGGMLKYLRRHPVPRVTIAGGVAKMTKLGAGPARPAFQARRGRPRWLAGRPAGGGARTDSRKRSATPTPPPRPFELRRRPDGIALVAIAAAAGGRPPRALRAAASALEVVVFDRDRRASWRRRRSRRSD